MASSTSAHLSISGKVFFGSLCAGTFGLGVWQVERLMEKIRLVEERQSQLEMEPTTSLEFNHLPYRRRLLQGTLRHDKEVLIGPRGAPPGVKLPLKGLSAMSGKTGNQSSGMSAGPQGYLVLTPFELSEGFSDRKMVWINRGWVPKIMVPGADQPYRRHGPVEASKVQLALAEGSYPSWSRPNGTIEITVVQSQVESEWSIKPVSGFYILFRDITNPSVSYAHSTRTKIYDPRT
jgi:cytochrome oxidase assembly protein ShyY1